jgi:hypothetical protein
VVILLYSDYSRRLLNKIFAMRGSEHGAAN